MCFYNVFIITKKKNNSRPCYPNVYTTSIKHNTGLVFRFMVLIDATFNNISAISWWSVLLVEETGVPGTIILYVL